MKTNWEEQDFTYYQWKTADYDTQANTFIEWCFERKCNGINQGGRILNEWRVRKQTYTSYLRSIVFDFEHYSQHDDTHSVNILNAIEMVVGRNRVKLLSASDLWLLLESAYFHDIGMALSEKEIRSLWKDEKFHAHMVKVLSGNDVDLKDAVNYYQQMDNLLNHRSQLENLGSVENQVFPEEWPVDFEKKVTILIADYVRGQHPKRSRRFMEMLSDQTKNEKKESIIKPRLDKLVADISELHGLNFGDIREKVEYHALGFDVEYLHPQFAAAMLRLGDLLDMDNNRFNLRALDHFGSMPVLSSYHYEKHKAIYHFVIDQKQIEAKAYSDESEVCRVISEWFQMLEKDVENLICDWNAFAPSRLKGCMLQRCKLEVYHEKTKFDAKWQKNFMVDQKRLLSLMTGSNIYDSEMDCLREYIQNALDASKMSLWLDIKYKKLRLENYADSIEQVSPFDIGRECYEKKTIEIHASVSLKSSQPCVNLEIVDHGLGMESECVDSLSVVGRSWKSRKIFQKEIIQMPEWLKPTGGFGIGLQSAFMLTDQVKIETKSAREPYGYSVELNSPEKGGSIIKMRNDKLYRAGTTVQFSVSLEKFYYLMNDVVESKEEYTGEERFSRIGNEDHVRNLLQKYVELHIPNTLFPIKVVGGKRNVCAYASPYASSHSQFRLSVSGQEQLSFLPEAGFDHIGDTFILNERYICSVIPELKVRIWDKKENVFICVESSPEIIQIFDQEIGKQINHFCYRNIRVNDIKEQERGLEYCDFLSVCIDFMGGKMEDVLSIRRNNFLTGFDLTKYYYEYLAVYIEAIDTAIESKLDKTEISHEKLPVFSFLLLAAQVMEQNKLEMIITHFQEKMLFTNYISVLRVKGNLVERDMIDAKDVLRDIRHIFLKKLKSEEAKDSSVESESNDVYFVTAQLPVKFNEKVPIVHLGAECPEEPLEQEVLSGLRKHPLIYQEAQICRVLLSVGRRYHMQHFRLSGGGRNTVKINPVYVMISGVNENWYYNQQNYLEEETFIRRAFWTGSNGRYIAKNVDCKKYNDLKIGQLPLQMSVDHNIKRQDTYLLSPINNAIYRKVLRRMEIDVFDIPDAEETDHAEPVYMHRIMSKEEFIDLVINDEESEQEYQYLLSWVYKNQLLDGACRLEMDAVKKKYIDMIVDIYNGIFMMKVPDKIWT